MLDSPGVLLWRVICISSEDGAFRTMGFAVKFGRGREWNHWSNQGILTFRGDRSASVRVLDGFSPGRSVRTRKEFVRWVYFPDYFKIFIGTSVAQTAPVSLGIKGTVGACALKEHSTFQRKACPGERTGVEE